MGNSWNQTAQCESGRCQTHYRHWWHWWARIIWWSHHLSHAGWCEVRFLNVSGDAILVGAKNENDCIQTVEKWSTSHDQKTVVEVRLVGRWRLLHSYTIQIGVVVDFFFIGWWRIYSTRQTQGITQTRSTCETNAFSWQLNAFRFSFERVKVFVRTCVGPRSNAWRLLFKLI